MRKSEGDNNIANQNVTQSMSFVITHTQPHVHTKQYLCDEYMFFFVFFFAGINYLLILSVNPWKKNCKFKKIKSMNNLLILSFFFFNSNNLYDSGTRLFISKALIFRKGRYLHFIKPFQLTWFN